MNSQRIPLFKVFPALIAHCPRLPIIAGATPVRKLHEISGMTGREIWVKQDNLSAVRYGGNKPRKLEFILADARRRGCSRILTVGGIGSNHCMATLIHGVHAGFKVHLLLSPQPEDAKIRAYLDHFQRAATQVVLAESYEVFPNLIRAITDQYPGIYFIPAGGSNPLGVLGFINAALELSEQIRCGALPMIESVVLPAGTCGTMVGLALGFRLAGLKIKTIGIRVVGRVVTNWDVISTLWEDTNTLLRSHDPTVPELKLTDRVIELRDEFFGIGYGYPTPEAETACELLKEKEGIELETTYSAKAMAAVLAPTQSTDATGAVLFWNTYAGRILNSTDRSSPSTPAQT